MKTVQELLTALLEVMHAWARQEGGVPEDLAALCYEVKTWLTTATHVETAVRTLLRSATLAVA